MIIVKTHSGLYIPWMFLCSVSIYIYIPKFLFSMTIKVINIFLILLKIICTKNLNCQSMNCIYKIFEELLVHIKHAWTANHKQISVLSTYHSFICKYCIYSWSKRKDPGCVCSSFCKCAGNIWSSLDQPSGNTKVTKEYVIE